VASTRVYVVCSTYARVYVLSPCVCVLSTGSLRVRDIFILCQALLGVFYVVCTWV
jgi:hypothetical protein